MRIIIGYLGDAYVKEEEILREAGAATIRVAIEQAMKTPAPWRGLGGAVVLLRGPRLPLDQYEAVSCHAAASGSVCLADPRTYRFGLDLVAQAEILRDMMPATEVLPSSSTPEEIKALLDKDRLRVPVFVRSDVESAAKYVGAAGCIIGTADAVEIEGVLKNLSHYVKQYRTVVIKEMFKPRCAADGKALEYRAIGMAGDLITFDWDESSELPDPEASALGDFARKVFARVNASGAKGLFVSDVALTEEGPGVVVECKNLLNSSLKRPKKLLRELARHHL